MLLRVLLLAAFAFAFGPELLAAQGPPTPVAAADSVVEIRMRDGSVLFGRIVERTETTFTVVTTGGTRVEVQRAQIERLRTVRSRGADGQYWSQDPNSTRLLFAPTARPLEQGEGYISSFMLFFPFVAYGVTDRLTLAGGTPVLPGLIGRVFYFAPKYTVAHRERSSFALGAIGFVATEQISSGSVGILYGTGTFGDADRALTVGSGWGYFTDWNDAEISGTPVFTLGGEVRVARGVKLISENWIGVSNGFGGLVTGGVRFIGGRLSADLGFGGAIDGGGCCIPLVNFVWSFGGSR